VSIYVTGASGFIGSHVARQLRERGVEIRDDWIDLGDRELLRTAIDGCDAVFHLAALYSYDAPASEHERVNVEGTRTVVELCRQLGVRRLVPHEHVRDLRTGARQASDGGGRSAKLRARRLVQAHEARSLAG
jgi:uncharacterized protein YbjT (DUF2867 family)